MTRDAVAIGQVITASLARATMHGADMYRRPRWTVPNSVSACKCMAIVFVPIIVFLVGVQIWDSSKEDNDLIDRCTHFPTLGCLGDPKLRDPPCNQSWRFILRVVVLCLLIFVMFMLAYLAMVLYNRYRDMTEIMVHGLAFVTAVSGQTVHEWDSDDPDDLRVHPHPEIVLNMHGRLSQTERRQLPIYALSYWTTMLARFLAFYPRYSASALIAPSLLPRTERRHIIGTMIVEAVVCIGMLCVVLIRPTTRCTVEGCLFLCKARDTADEIVLLYLSVLLMVLSTVLMIIIARAFDSWDAFIAAFHQPVFHQHVPVALALWDMLREPLQAIPPAKYSERAAALLALTAVQLAPQYESLGVGHADLDSE